jgi:fibronectin-binding autotransporter adhesin
MLNGTTVSATLASARKTRFVSGSVGVALSITVSTAPVLANEHLALIDVGLHHQVTFDQGTHLVAGDHTSHFSGLDHHGTLPTDHHGSYNLDHNAQIHTGSMPNFSQNDNTHTIQRVDDNGHTHNIQNSFNHHDGTVHGSTLVHTPTQDFNLSSAAHDFLASNLAGFHNITINVGGTTEVVNLHSRLTAAEFVAAEQVLAGNPQTITLSHSGQAVGGTVVLDNTLLSAIDHSVGGSISSLTITHGVQLIDTVGALSITGNINNYGSILTASNVAGQTDTISANAIINEFNGVVDSYLGNLAGLFSAGSVLSAMSSITNFGTIGSAASLSLNAPTVSNISSGGHIASMSAVQDLNINTAHLINSGDISSALSGINVASTGNLLVENAGGTIQANNINLLSNNAALQVMGGNFDSNALNLKAGHSTLNLQADNVSGVVNASADNVHLYTSQSNLNLGNIDSSGDPTLASQGNIIIDGTIAPTNGANLAIVSGANILSGTGGKLDTRSTAVGGGNGGNLSLIAGANFTVDGSGNVVLTDSANAGKGSATGGLIDLRGGDGGSAPISAITTAGTGTTGNAGYIQMVAYSGNAPNTGLIFIPTNVTIDASAAGGKRGDVSLILGNAFAGASIGGITGNKITVSTLTPTVGAGMSFDGTGTASNGINSFATTGSLLNETLQIGGNVSATNDINISSGSVNITGNVSANGSGGQVGGATLDGENGHNINITALQSLSVQGNISAVGGGGAGSGSGTPGLNGGRGGDGGQVALIKQGFGFGGANITGNINVSGGGGGGGAGGSETAAATQGGAGGHAGTVKINASNISINAPVLAYDGGAGGNGGSSALGVGAGGGGGSAYGGAGGGGGGGTGNNAGDFAAGGGGGFSLASGSGGGGGGVYGSAGAATLSFGGNGGSALGNGTGGTGDINGLSGVGSSGGNGGGIAGTAPGGAGAATATSGGIGGQTAVAGQGAGQTGSGAKVITGHGLVDVAASSGSLRVETGALKVGTTGGNGGTLTIVDAAGVPLNLISAGSAFGNLNLTTAQNAGTTGADGTINVLGNVSGQSVTITTNGDAGPNNINIFAPFVGGPQFSTAILTSNGGSITTTGAGSINTLAGSARATGNVNVNTNTGAPNFAQSFFASSTNGSVTINQGAQTGVFGGSVGDAGGTFTLNAANPVTISGITTNGGAINVNTTGGNYGITLAGPISTGSTAGSVTIAPSGLGSITQQTFQAGSTITSSTINLLTNANIGTAAAPVQTNAINNGTINTTYGSAGNVYLNDSSTGVVTVNTPTASTGTLSVGSQASQLNIPQANFTNVLISDSGPVGNVLLNSGNNAAAVIGNGTGSVAVSATGNIDSKANNTGIAGTSTSFTSTNGNIGAGRRLQVSGATLTAKAANGSVDVQTAQATTINGAGGTSFNLIDTASGSPVTVNGPIAANNVNIQTVNATGLTINGSLGNSSASSVNVTSGGNVAVQAGSTVEAANIAINSSTNSVSFGSINTSNVNLSTGSGVVAISTSATPGGTDQISSGGDLTLVNNFNSTNNLAVSAAGNLTVGSTTNHATSLSGSTLKVTGQSLTNFGNLNGVNGVTVTTSGAGGITNSGGAVLTSGGNIALDSSAGNGPITNAGTVTGTGAGTEVDLLAGNGTISNSGTISAQSFIARGQSEVNSGSVTTSLGLLFDANGAGGITNTGTGALTGSGVTLEITGGTGPINNAGRITASSVGFESAGGNSSQISNTGVVSSASMDATGQSFINSGSITSTNGITVTTNGSGGITNTSTGSLISSAAVVLDASAGNGPVTNSGALTGADITFAAGSGAVTNAASISGTSFTSSGQSFSNSAFITGNNSVSIRTNGSGGINNTHSAALISTGAVLLDSSAGNGPINNAGSIQGNGLQLVAGNGTVTNASGASIVSSGALSFQASAINNQGSASAQTALSFAGPASGDLTISGANGGFTTAGGASLNLQSSGNITVNGGNSNPFSGLTQLGNFTVNAGGNFTSPLNSIALVADGSGNGGAINITANNVVYNGSATRTTPFLLSANGGNAAGDNGGSVNLNLFGTTAQGLTVGNNAGNFKISATGANGGQVNITTPGNLKVNTAEMLINATSSTGTGSSVTLNGGQVLLVGNLDTHNGSGSSGAINITSASTTAFIIDGSKTTTTNGQIGITNNQGISGSTITINNSGGVVLADNDVLSGPGAITINGSGLTNNGKVNTANLVINAIGNGNLTTGSTGTYQNLPMQALSLTSQTGSFNISGNTPSANQITIAANNGAVNFSNSAESLRATPDGSGNGGTINISGRTFTSSDLAISAAGTTGNGGNVNITLSGASPLTIGNNDVTVDVSNKSGHAGGNVTIANGGNISVDANYLNMGNHYAAGQGANLSLVSGGKVLIDNANRLPSTINNLTLSTNSSTAFALGGASSNGFSDNNQTISATNLSITNNGGAILLGSGDGLSGSTVSLTALGDIGKSSSPIAISTPTLNLTSATGSAFVDLSGKANTDFVASAAKTLSISSTGSIASSQLVSASSLYLNAANINPDFSMLTTNANYVTAKSTNNLNILDTQTSQVTLGPVTAVNGSAQFTSNGGITVNGAFYGATNASITAGGIFNGTVSSSTGDLVLNSTLTSLNGAGLNNNGDGSVITHAAITAPNNIFVGVQGAGSVSLGGSLNASLNSPSSSFVTVSIQGSGSLSETTPSASVKGQFLNISTNGGNIGSQASPFKIQSPNIRLAAANPAVAYIANTNTLSSGQTFVGGSYFGSLHFTDTNVSNSNHGSLLVGSLSAEHEISISTNEQNLIIGGGTNTFTRDGNITYQNTYAKNGSNSPSIQIQDGANIHASSYGSTDTGNVYIVLGNVPATADLLPGVAPTGGSPTITGTVYFGSVAHPNGSITTNTGDSLSGLARNLVFSTNGLPASQITLGQNVTIVADPPIAAGTVAPDFGHLQYATAPSATLANESPTTGALSANTASATPAVLLGTAVPTATLPVANLPVSNPAALSSFVPAASTAAAQAVLDNSSVDRTTALGSGNSLSTPKSNLLTGGVSNLSRRALEKGAMLLAPDQNTVVQTPHGLVSVSAGAVALLVSFEHGLAVYDLHDSHKESVMLLSGNQKISLSPGKNIVLTGNTREFEDVNPVKFVGYRGLSSRAISNDTKVYCSEFELLSMVQGLRPISSLVSSDNPKTRKTMGNLLKTAAILLELGQGGEQFKYYVPKELMAYAASKSH